jgi:hypothetical protein
VEEYEEAKVHKTCMNLSLDSEMVKPITLGLIFICIFLHSQNFMQRIINSQSVMFSIHVASLSLILSDL